MDSVVLTLIAVIGLSAGVVFLIDFKRMPSHLYKRGVAFWARVPGVSMDYTRIVPFWLYRYVQALAYLGAAVIALTVLVKSM